MEMRFHDPEMLDSLIGIHDFVTVHSTCNIVSGLGLL